jgi:hypothetical protein
MRRNTGRQFDSGSILNAKRRRYVVSEQLRPAVRS